MVLPTLPAIGQTPYGNFGPTQLTSMTSLLSGGTSITRGLNYQNPTHRMVALTVSMDWNNLPTLPDRMAVHLQRALVWHLQDVAESCIHMAQQDLTPGHGYVTGRLNATA